MRGIGPSPNWSSSPARGHAARSAVVDSRLLGLEGDGRRIAPQEPFAAVLGCADARVPIELVFNEGPNELFVVRVAGNGLGPDVLGSFHYAISHLRKSLRLLVVLGHSGCGALTAAVDAFLDPGGYLEIATNEQLRSIVDRHLIAVQASARALARVYGSDVMDRLPGGSHRGCDHDECGPGGAYAAGRIAWQRYLPIRPTARH